MSKNKIISFGLICLVFFIGMLLGSFGYSKFFIIKVENEIVINSPLPQIIEEIRPTTKSAKLINILLMGNGGVGHSGGGLMDAIILVSVNVTDKKVSLVSIPRDLWFSGHKINADVSIKDAVAGITGLSVPYQISIDFSGFVKMVDSLNGITVDVKKAYTDNFYPVKGKENELCGFSNEQIAEYHQKYTGFELEKQFVCRYETLQFPQGKQDMNGEIALKYVRSRHGGSDFIRSQHQFEALKAILQKANIKNVANVFDFVKTNLNLDNITKILTEIGSPLEYSISSINLSEENVLQPSKSSAGAYILVEKEGMNVKEYIKNNL